MIGQAEHADGMGGIAVGGRPRARGAGLEAVLGLAVLPAVEGLRERRGRLLAHDDVHAVTRLDARVALRRDRGLAAHDDHHGRLRRQRQIAQAPPDGAVVGPDPVLRHLGAEPGRRAAVAEGPRERRFCPREPEPARQGLERRPLQDRREDDDEEGDVEHPAAAGHPGEHGEGGQDDGYAAAEPGPAEQDALAGPQALQRRHGPHGRGPRHEGEEERERRRAAGDGDEVRRHDEQPERQEQGDLREPGDAVVEVRQRGPRRKAGRGREREAGDVDREEARPVQHVGRAEGQAGDRERRDGVQARDRKPRDREQPCDAETHARAAHEPRRELADEQHEHVGDAVVGLQQPRREPEHEEHGDRIVEARLALEHQREPRPQRRPAQQGEHRRAVRRRECGAHEHPLQEPAAEEHRRGHAREQRGHRRCRRSRAATPAAAPGARRRAGR